VGTVAKLCDTCFVTLNSGARAHMFRSMMLCLLCTCTVTLHWRLLGNVVRRFLFHSTVQLAIHAITN
jgi:hypothetical protein